MKGNMNKCIRCGHDIEPERISVLPDTNYCICCAKIVQPKRLKGITVFSEGPENAPEFLIVTPEQFEIGNSTAYVDDLDGVTAEDNGV